MKQGCFTSVGGCHSSGLEQSYCTSRCHEIAGASHGDSTAPVTGVTTSPSPIGGPPYTSRAWFKESPRITLTATDAGSGPAGVHARVNGGVWSFHTGSVATVTVSATGTSTVDYYSVDRVGNEETTRTYLTGVDTTAPATQASLYSSPNRWALSSSDGVFDQSGGIYAIYYTFDGRPYSAIRSSNPSPAYTTLYNVVSGPIDTWGTHTLTYYAVDNVGNAEATKTISYYAPDSLAPTARLESVGMTSARISATDVGPTFSGVRSISYRWAYSPTWTTVTFSASLSPTSTQVADVVGEGTGYFPVLCDGFRG